MKKYLLILVVALALAACGPDPVEMAKLDVMKAQARADEAYADARAEDAEARAAEAEAQSAAQIASAEAHRDQILALADQNATQDKYVYALYGQLNDLIRRQQDLALLAVLAVLFVATLAAIVKLAIHIYGSKPVEQAAPQQVTHNYYIVRRLSDREEYELNPAAWEALLALPEASARYELIEVE